MVHLDKLLEKENSISPIPNFVPTESFRTQGILSQATQKHSSNSYAVELTFVTENFGSLFDMIMDRNENR